LTSEGHITGTSDWKIPTKPLTRRFDHHEEEHESFLGPSSEPKSFEPEIPSSRQPGSSWSPPFAPDREQRSTHRGQTETKWSPAARRPARDEPSFQEPSSRRERASDQGHDKQDKQDRREPERQTKQDERSTWERSQKSKEDDHSKKESPFSSRDQPEESRRPFKKDEDKKFGPESKKTGEEDFMEGVRKLFFLNLSSSAEYQQDDNSFNTAFLY